MVERELKWRLTPSAWSAFQSQLALPPRLILEQRNYYFDDPERRLALGSSMLRLRWESGKWIWCYKRGVSLEGGYFAAVEVETELNESQAQRLLEGDSQGLESTPTARELAAQGLEGPWERVGEIANRRQVWEGSLVGLKGGERLELDETTFGPGLVEYELEIETADPQGARQVIEGLAARGGWSLEVQRATKYERFLKYYYERQPLVSILMPLYNCEATLINALRSVAWQTFPGWELILVDDGSQDDTLELAKSWCRNEPRAKLIAQEHGGIESALNRALAESRGAYIARMDSDDISHPKRLARQLEYLAAHPEIQAVGSKVRIFPSAQLTEGMERYQRWLNKTLTPELIERDMLVESPLVHPSVLMRRAAVESLGAYVAGSWPEDYHLWLRFWSRRWALGKVDEVLLYWRDSPQRLTRVDPRCSHDSLRNLKVDFFLRTFWGAEEGGWSLPPDKRRLIIWGAGPNGKALVKTLRAKGLEPAYFTDILPARHGQTICGLRVLPLEGLPDPRDYFLLTAVGNPYSREEIRAFLRARGWLEGRDFYCMAGISD